MKTRQQTTPLNSHALKTPIPANVKTDSPPKNPSTARTFVSVGGYFKGDYRHSASRLVVLEIGKGGIGGIGEGRNGWRGWRRMDIGWA